MVLVSMLPTGLDNLQFEIMSSHKISSIDIVKLKYEHDNKTYKMEFGTFQKYCKLVHGIHRSHAYVLLGYNKRPKHLISENLRWEIWERDNFTCQKCGSRRLLHVDHIIPESCGGSLSKDNLQTLCRKCNLKKGSKK